MDAVAKDRSPAPRHAVIARSGPTPLYHQVLQILLSEIEGKQWGPRQLFATEAELEKRFGVSRATVRRALAELVQQGRLERIAGRGTFVKRPPLEVTLPHLLSFSEEIVERGMVPSTEVVAVERLLPPAEVAEGLDVSTTREVVRVKRVRYADLEPTVYMIDYLAPDITTDPGLDFARSLYELLSEELGVRVSEATHCLRAVLLPDEICGLLRVPVGSPGMYMTRTSFDDSRRPIVYEQAYCRGDNYEYNVRLRHKGGRK